MQVKDLHVNYNNLYALLLASGLGGFAPLILADDAQDVGLVNITGKQNLGNGHMIREESAKARSTVTKEAMDEMSPTANAIDKLKYTPGINVSSDDASGTSGTNFTMRGMNSDQVGVSVDGVPINDSGSYGVYSNQMGDSENLAEVFATQGSSEADGPHIGSSGGNIGMITLRPTKESGAFIKQTIGANDLRKTFARVNTGELGGFKSWVSASHLEGGKWRGKGTLRSDKVEWSGLFEDDSGNSTLATLKYNNQENYNYNSLSKAQFEQEGRRKDYPETPIYKSGLLSASYKLNRNPFESVNATLTQRWRLRDDLLLTVTPYYYWSNGGSFSGQTASNLGPRSDKGGNYDLSNLKSANYYRPSWTETWRPGVTAKLKWDINEQHSLDYGYWYERARQRQTQPFIGINSEGAPDDVWGDYNDGGQVVDKNGKTVQGRHYYTVTPAQKLWVQDNWQATPDLSFVGGLAYQYVERDGNNLGSLYDKPEKRNARYHQFLPNFSAKYQVDDSNQAFYNVTRNMRTPPNYVLYNKGDSLSLKPELSWNQELGWRYTEDAMALSATLFYITFKDRQLSTTDLNGDFVMANVGSVNNKGLELEWSGLLPHNFNYYASYTYTQSEQQDDFVSKNALLPTSGKQLANVPKNMFNLVFGYDDSRFYGNIAGKYVGSFYGDLTNNEKIDGRTVFDLNAGIYLPVDKKVIKSAALRFSMLNVFDKEYLSSVRTVSFNSAPVNGLGASTAYYNVGEERTAMVSLEANF